MEKVIRKHRATGNRIIGTTSAYLRRAKGRERSRHH